MMEPRQLRQKAETFSLATADLKLGVAAIAVTPAAASNPPNHAVDSDLTCVMTDMHTLLQQGTPSQIDE